MRAAALSIYGILSAIHFATFLNLGDRKMENGRKALVTGGAGFLGSHLVRALLADGWQVAAMDSLLTGNTDNIDEFAGNPSFEFIKHDVTEPYDGPWNLIANLACPASPPRYQADPVHTWETSVLGALNAARLARKNGATLFHASTSEVYGDPEIHPQTESYWGHVNCNGVRSCYDEGKRAAETLLADFRRQYGLDVRMVRFFNTYGPAMDPEDGRVVTNMIIAALRGRDIPVYGDGTQTRSFQYASDAIEAVMRLIRKPREEIDAFCAAKKLSVPVFNIGNPGEFTINELADLVLREIPGTGSKTVNMPLPGDDPKRRRPDISLAGELLGWKPVVPLSEGLPRTIEYFKAKCL